MPQADDELREAWGHGTDAGDAEMRANQHLLDAGFIFVPMKWGYRAPPGYVLTERDWSALDYLVGEWDYAGLVL